MVGASVAINTPVFTSSIGVNTCVETDIGALVGADDTPRVVSVIVCLRRGAVVGFEVGVGFVVEALEAVGRVGVGAAAVQGQGKKGHRRSWKREKDRAVPN
jgi:hypothetical protein